ncbi:MAG: immunoglobulin domain-containing protein [Limisphaera sp.]|nr:immunoglobulin domain-containing protein [Limisphaera sp.]
MNRVVRVLLALSNQSFGAEEVASLLQSRHSGVVYLLRAYEIVESMRRRPLCWGVWVGIACFLLTRVGHGQLAITEAMSSASTNNLLGVTQGPDFWELTNFGSEPVDLTGYRWNDNDGGLAGADSAPFNGLVIGAGETILFVQNNVSGWDTPEAFRAWWGLPATQRVVFYSGNGLSSNGDSVILWGPGAVSDEDILDRVDFGPATSGHSFTYSTADGSFGVVSQVGQDGAFVAALSADVGSPGRHRGPVSLRITSHPTNVTAVAGFPAHFVVVAQGMPRPRYQWLKNGLPLAGATRSVLQFSAVQASDAGLYNVLVSNGLATVVSSNATLTVLDAAVPPTFTRVPLALEAYEGQTVTFVAAAQGQPVPELQWFKNGVPIPGANSGQLRLERVGPLDTATYMIRASNLAGTTNYSVQLTVTRKPRLLITEVHSTGSSDYQDWWELTSLDVRPISLRGFRFDDDSRSLGAAFVITNDLIISPGESIIFVESTAARPMTPERFRSWWGDSHLPPSLKIVVYQGSGLGLSSAGDAVYLWNAAAVEDADYLCGVMFTTAPSNPRRTFVYDPDRPEPQTPHAAVLTRFATNGVNGAFEAVNGDVGSPGRVVEIPRLHVFAFGSELILYWTATPGRVYVLESTDRMGWPQDSWAEMTRFSPNTVDGRYQIPRSGAMMFYRLGVALPFPGS